MPRSASPRYGERSPILPPHITPLAEARPPPARLWRALPSYLGISVHAEAPRAEPVPAWPYPNNWSGLIALQPLTIAHPRVRMLPSAAAPIELFRLRISRINLCSPGHSCYSSYWRLLRCSRKGLGDSLVTSPPLHSHTAGRVTARWVIPGIRITATHDKNIFFFTDIYRQRAS